MSDIRINASKCPECGKIIFPPRDLCPYCRRKVAQIDRIELGNEGEVLSFTELHNPPEGFTPPLRLALVELEQDTIVLCLGESNDDSDISIGCTVELTFDNEKRFRFRIVQ